MHWNTVAGSTRYQLNQNFGGNVTVPYNAGGTSWVANALAAGTYYYQVFACNAAGCSPGSTVIAVDVYVPAAPVLQGPYSTPTGKFTISWNAPTGATSYQLTQNGSNVYTGSGLSWNANIRLNGGYQYQVKACDGVGCSVGSNVVS